MFGVKRKRGVILLGRFLDESIPIRKEVRDVEGLTLIRARV